ncbi:MAG TPA: MAB_1171c family putative transporter [Thermomonospora sp.]|nr:MAB_1171c family putative transporter [Thermomonospora sp.]
MIRNLAFPFCAAVLTAIFVYKLRHLRSQWGNARLWALCGTVFFFGATLWSASPAAAAWINRVTGVTNLAELVAAICLSGLAALFLILALLWRYPTSLAWPRLRWVLAGYSLLVTVISVLFVLSDVPVERTIDYPYYYARQPTVAVSYTVYYTSTLAGSTILARWCFGWARHPDYAGLPYLRRGLRMYAGFGVVLSVYSLVRLVSLAGNWFGTDALNPIGSAASVVGAPFGCFFLAAAMVVPVYGPRWPRVRRAVRRAARFRTLRSLHRALTEVDPSVVFVARGRRLDLQHRIRRAIIELSDWRWALAPLFDATVEEVVHGLAGRDLPEEELATLVEATQLRVALEAWRAGARSAGAPAHVHDERDGNDIDLELEWWCQVARAFARSPLVDQAVARVRGPDTAPVSL